MPASGMQWAHAYPGAAMPSNALVLSRNQVACAAWSGQSGVPQAIIGAAETTGGGCTVVVNGVVQAAQEFEVLLNLPGRSAGPWTDADRSRLIMVRGPQTSLPAGAIVAAWILQEPQAVCLGYHEDNTGGFYLVGRAGFATRGCLVVVNGRPIAAQYYLVLGNASGPNPAAAYQPTGAARPETDQPDDSPTAQIHVVYALARNSLDAQRDVRGSIADQVEVAQAWLMAQVGRRLRFDTYQGRLDVTLVRLTRTWEEVRTTGLDRVMTEALFAAGLTAPHKYQVVFYEGPRDNGDCGAYGGAGTRTVILLQRVDASGALVPCGYASFAARGDGLRTPDGRGTLARSLLHEVFHGLGVVPACAPGHRDGGPGNRAHLGAGSDIMSAAPNSMTETLDSARTEYYGHRRSDCLDLARSAIWQDASAGDGFPNRPR